MSAYFSRKIMTKHWLQENDLSQVFSKKNRDIHNYIKTILVRFNTFLSIKVLVYEITWYRCSLFKITCLRDNGHSQYCLMGSIFLVQFITFTSMKKFWTNMTHVFIIIGPQVIHNTQNPTSKFEVVYHNAFLYQINNFFTHQSILKEVCTNIHHIKTMRMSHVRHTDFYQGQGHTKRSKLRKY
jgi:hypothetical protein